LNFSVTGNTGTCSSTTIPAGYQTLTLQLLDSGKPVMGAVEVVRIVAGQTTTGSYTFANVNQPGGSVQVNITPAMAEPIPVSISGVPATVSVGGSMAAAASVSDGTANVTYVWYLNGVSVGIGPTYVLGSTVPAGWYRLDVTAYAAAGTRAGSATASFQVNGVFAPGNSFFYAVNYIDNTVSAYDRGSRGLLTPLSIPTFTTGVPKGQGGPECIAATPNGSFVYVANVNPSNSVSAYSIGVDGLLTPLGPPMPSNGSGVFGIAIAPNGSFLYIANYSSNSVSGYSIGSDGRLTPLSTPNFDTAGGVLYGIAITPKGSFLYVTSQHSNIVSGYAIGSGGLLTPLNTPTFATGASPWEIAITPDGSFLYVTNQDSSTVSGFAIGPNGLLTPLSTPVFSTGSSPRGIVVTPNGSFLYVVNDGDGTVSAYAIGSGGLLTPLSIPTFPTGGAPNKITVAPDGSTLYVGNSGSNSVTAYAIGFDGLLTPLNASGFTTGHFPLGIVVVPRR
jgi:DNA-binding beta-propeller fold protein YncE